MPFFLLVALLLKMSAVTGAVTKLNCKIQEALCFHECCPNGARATNDLVNNTIYVLSSNRTTKFADWVAYAVEAKNLGGQHNGVRNWKKDPSISAQHTLRPGDYSEAYELEDYDRGHQAPLADFTNNEDWAKSNYLSNITPQQSNLNRGAWERLEKAERDLIKKHHYSYVHIVTGPYYDQSDSMPSLPNSHLEHIVPSGYWKVIAIENSDKKIGVAAFKLEQYQLVTLYCDQITDLTALKSITNLDILPDLTSEDIDELTSIQLLSNLNCPPGASSFVDI